MNSSKMIFKTRPYLLLACLFHGAQVYAFVTGKIYYTAEALAAVYTGFPVMRYIDHAAAAMILIALLLQFITCVRIRRDRPASRSLLGTAYGFLIASQVCYALARRIVTGLTPFTYSAVLQTALYVLLFVLIARTHNSETKCGDNNEGKQDIVCSDSVLQGTGSAAGNSESPETENGRSDGEGTDRPQQPGDDGQ